jgi:hypothetical protein
LCCGRRGGTCVGCWRRGYFHRPRLGRWCQRRRGRGEGGWSRDVAGMEVSKRYFNSLERFNIVECGETGGGQTWTSESLRSMKMSSVSGDFLVSIRALSSMPSRVFTVVSSEGSGSRCSSLWVRMVDHSESLQCLLLARRSETRFCFTGKMERWSAEEKE